MATYLDQVEVINLNSCYDGWVEDVNDILSEIDDRTLIKNSVPRLPINKLLQRLRELKYVCLVDDLTIIETRRIFKSIEHDEDDRERDYFDDLYDRMLDAPDSDDEENRPEEELFDDWPMNNSSDPSKPSRDDPFNGVDPDDPDHQDIIVIVDCYGMYTPSLLRWLKVYMKRGMRKTAIVKILNELNAHPEKDGPAILFSPDLIKTIYPMIVNSPNEDIRKLLPLKSNPDKRFLKMTLLHELGHHVYKGPTTILSEAMANWFVYGFLNADDRRLMYEKTGHQTKPYQMYLGMVSLLYPNNFSAGYPAVAFPWPVPTGKEIVEYIENDAFNGSLRKKPSPGIVQSHWQKYGEWIDWSWVFYNTLIRHLPDPLSRRNSSWNTKFHPIQSDGYKLLEDVLYHCTGRKEIADLMQRLETMVKDRTGACFIPMNRKKQMEWLLEKFGVEHD